MPINDLQDARDEPRYRYRPLPGHEPPPPPPEPEKPDERPYGKLQTRILDILKSEVGRRWTVREIAYLIGGRRQYQGYDKALRRLLARKVVEHESSIIWPFRALWYIEDWRKAKIWARPATNEKKVRRNYAGTRVANTTPRPVEGGI